MPSPGALGTAPLLSVADLKVQFRIGGGLLSRRPAAILKAVDGVNFELRPGETLGLVGESGCGKSTLGRAVLRLLPIATGRIVWLGQDLAQLSHEDMRRKRQEMQIVFQDPYGSLSPRLTVGQIVTEGLLVHAPELPRAEVRGRGPGVGPHDLGRRDDGGRGLPVRHDPRSEQPVHVADDVAVHAEVPRTARCRRLGR